MSLNLGKYRRGRGSRAQAKLAYVCFGTKDGAFERSLPGWNVGAAIRSCGLGADAEDDEDAEEAAIEEAEVEETE